METRNMQERRRMRGKGGERELMWATGKGLGE